MAQWKGSSEAFKLLSVGVANGDKAILPPLLLYPNNSEMAYCLPITSSKGCDFKFDDGTVSIPTAFLPCPQPLETLKPNQAGLSDIGEGKSLLFGPRIRK